MAFFPKVSITQSNVATRRGTSTLALEDEARQMPGVPQSNIRWAQHCRRG